MNDDFQQWFTRHHMDYDQFDSQRWTLHRTYPDVTISQYRCRILHSFGKKVSAKTLVYLDLKYWISMRDSILGRKVDPIYQTLYVLLKQAVEKGQLLCPLSFWIFQELLKQSDLVTRRATARLIDQLSDGVAFMPHGEIVAQELLRWIRRHTHIQGTLESWPIKECIWTRTASFIGDAIPTWPDLTFSKPDQLLIQKIGEDLSFFPSFEYFLSDFAITPEEFIFRSENIEAINQNKQSIRQQHSTFKSLFLAELMHTIKENELHWFETTTYLHALVTGAEEEDVDLSKIPETLKNGARNLLWMYFKLGKHTNDLPSYHIPASLYAEVGWNPSRQMKPNDVFDFLHAQLAIPYCDVFLTERSLRSMCTSTHLHLDKTYNTNIISDPDEAARFFQHHAEQALTSPRVVRELFESDTYALA